MSHYKQYVEERRAPECGVIENEYGFIEYKLFPELKEVMICDLFVIPEKRNSGIGKQLEKLVIDKFKDECDYISCTVDITANNAEHSLGVIMHTGYRLVRLSGTLIFLGKEL